MSQVTRILQSIEAGDIQAAEQLLPLVYDELRKLARYRLAQENAGQSLQATALVHEAYLRLVGGQAPEWSGRNHFIGAAGEAMRRILIEQARRRKSKKRGGEFNRIELDADLGQNDPQRDDRVLALDAALSKLESQDPVKAELVKLRFFTGLTNREAAEMLGLSTATAERYWSFARAWLMREMQD